MTIAQHDRRQVQLMNEKEHSELLGKITIAKTELEDIKKANNNSELTNIEIVCVNQ